MMLPLLGALLPAASFVFVALRCTCHLNRSVVFYIGDLHIYITFASIDFSSACELEVPEEYLEVLCGENIFSLIPLKVSS